MSTPVHDMQRGTHILGTNYNMTAPPDDKPDLDLMNAIRAWGRRKNPQMWVEAVKFRIEQIAHTFRRRNGFHVILIQDLRHVEDLKGWPSAMSVWLEGDADFRSSQPGWFADDPFEKGGQGYLDRDSGFSMILNATKKPEDCAQDIYNYFEAKLENVFN